VNRATVERIMHEAGLAQQVIDACTAELHARGGHHATRVVLRIGALSAVDPEALRFCFDALKQDTRLGSALLDIEWRAATASWEDATALDIRTLEFETEVEA
jgi:hydrogenase nickel incorporation protein HypA/HybF